MSELKKLEPGKTEIGKVVSKDQDGMIRDFVIYYGNAASPLVDGNVMHLKESRYQEMLRISLSRKTERAMRNRAKRRSGQQRSRC